VECDERLASQVQRAGICAARSGEVLPQGHDRHQADEADDDDRPFHDAKRDIVEGDGFVHPPENRKEDDGGGDVAIADDLFMCGGVILCHGSPTWSFLYRGIVTRLRDRFRCVAIDYLGFSLSGPPEHYGYTIEEHIRTVGELVDHLALDQFIVMGQDWGGPIGTAVASERADRVSGLVLGNTWFWPAALRFRLFSRDNFFVEKLMPAAMTKKLSEAEKDHYRNVQPTPTARKGVAEMPKQIVGAQPLLERLSREVPAKLGSKPALFVWGMKDLGFRPSMLRRMRLTFPDQMLVELPNAKHYIQEDAPAEIADAIGKRFG
jgi:haloalkane dehalogenase